MTRPHVIVVFERAELFCVDIYWHVELLYRILDLEKSLHCVLRHWESNNISYSPLRSDRSSSWWQKEWRIWKWVMLMRFQCVWAQNIELLPWIGGFSILGYKTLSDVVHHALFDISSDNDEHSKIDLKTDIFWGNMFSKYKDCIVPCINTILWPETLQRHLYSVFRSTREKYRCLNRRFRRKTHMLWREEGVGSLMVDVSRPIHLIFS